MNKFNLPDTSEVAESFFTTSKNVSLIALNDKPFYHNLESLVKCPRCQNLSELVEDGPIRSLYRCRDCGIFAKLTHKKKRPDGLRYAIAQGELTKALEILEVAGHLDQDAIAALNLYRGDASQDDQKGGRGNA